MHRFLVERPERTHEIDSIYPVPLHFLEIRVMRQIPSSVLQAEIKQIYRIFFSRTKLKTLM